ASRTARLPHGPYALDALLGIVATDLHLYGPVATVKEAAHLVEERLSVEVHVDPAAVGPDPVARAAEEPVERQPGLFPEDVPKGDVDRSECVAGQAARAEGVELPPAARPDPLNVPRVLTADERRQISVHQLPDGRAPEPAA